MPKWRHENPHAERLIGELRLVGWKSRRELAAAERAREKIEGDAAALAARRSEAAELVAEARRLRGDAITAELAAVTPDDRQRAYELAGEALQAERVARCAVAALPVPWAELSPNELAFRWMLERAAESAGETEWGEPLPSHYSAWAHSVRTKWIAAKKHPWLTTGVSHGGERFCHAPAGGCLARVQTLNV